MKFITIHIFTLLVLFLAFSLFSPVVTFGQDINGVPKNYCDPNGGRICNPINQNSLEGFLKTVLEGVIKIALPIIALAIIYCGFLFVKARGNTEELTKAKDALLYTLIGAAILLGAYALAQLIGDTVNALK